MTSMEIVPATLAHAHELAPLMREEDVAEVQAAAGFSPLEGLLESLAVSSISRTLLFDGKVAAIFGVAPMDALEGVGSVWMLTGEGISRNPFLFLRICRAQIQGLLEQWPVLVYAIDARYERAIRWAKWVGCEMSEATPYGIENRVFVPFVLRRR